VSRVCSGVAELFRLFREGVVVGPDRSGGDPPAHSELEHHRPGDRRHPLEVVRRAVRHGAEDDLLGGVTDVREVGAGQPCHRLARKLVELHVVGERLPARVDAEDRLAACEVGRGDDHLPVEAARPKKRRVEVLDAVRGAHDDDLVAAAEPVELDKELVQALVVLAVEG